MKLDVLPSEPADQPWYDDGLTFTCQQCGNCCTGGPGYVWVSDVELERLAAFLGIPREEAIERHCRRIGQRISLNERLTPQGLYDCTFLQEVKRADGHVKRICSIYDVRPLQCRTWPFWDGLLASPERWNEAGKRCHGINHGARRFTRQQVEALRDARDWPENPPTSANPASANPASAKPKPAKPTRAHRASARPPTAQPSPAGSPSTPSSTQPTASAPRSTSRK